MTSYRFVPSSVTTPSSAHRGTPWSWRPGISPAHPANYPRMPRSTRRLSPA